MNRWQKLGVELWDIFKPIDAQSFWQLVLLIALILFAWLTRNYQGGFWKAITRTFWIMVVLFVLGAISPYLMWGYVGILVVKFIFGRTRIPLRTVIINVVITATIVGFIYMFLT